MRPEQDPDLAAPAPGVPSTTPATLSPHSGLRQTFADEDVQSGPPPDTSAHAYAASALFPDDVAAAPVEQRRLARVPWWWNPLAHLVLLAIFAYQRCIPDGRKRQCIFTPSCSRYCQAAIRLYGLLRGLLYTWGRFRRCNEALSRGGLDPP